MNPTASTDNGNIQSVTGALPANNFQDSNLQQVQQKPVPSEPVTPEMQIKKIEEKVAVATMPQELHEKAVSMIERLKLLQKEPSFILEYDNTSRYIDWICSLPWNFTTQDILDLNHARQVFDKNHYGLTEVKNKIMEYLSVMILNKTRGTQFASRAPIISLVGLAGVGKTTIAYSIAEALGRKIQRIPFGGMGAAAQLRGQSRFSPDAEPGQIIKTLRRAGTKNPILLFDEIDRVSEYARADIMGVLVELLDPEQNKAFTDHYIDYPFDLSQVFFIATSNNTKDIANAVVDRLEVIQMPSYNDNEKVVIAKSYILPQTLAESGMNAQDVTVADDAWVAMIRALGYDSGVRSLKRNIADMVRRIARYKLEGKISQGQAFAVTTENMKEFVNEWL